MKKHIVIKKKRQAKRGSVANRKKAESILFKTRDAKYSIHLSVPEILGIQSCRPGPRK